MDRQPFKILWVELTGSGGNRVFVVWVGVIPSTGRPLCGGKFDAEPDAVTV
jgi:hypothetical protein